MFTPIGEGNNKLSDKIVEQIKNQILLGEFKPGDKLPSENELCEMFQVSRTSVREAIKMLSAQGLAKVMRGRGIFVEQLDLEHLLRMTYPIILTSQTDLEDVMHIRIVLEKESASLAAKNATADDILQMERIIKKSMLIDENAPRAFEEISEANSAFHRMRAKSSRAKVLLHAIQPLWYLIEQSRRITLNAPARKLKSVQEHARILEAVKAHDPAQALAEISNHLYGVKTVLHESNAKHRL